MITAFNSLKTKSDTAVAHYPRASLGVGALTLRGAARAWREGVSGGESFLFGTTRYSRKTHAAERELTRTCRRAAPGSSA
eukprot:scaffold77919_cov63-Phaeocystis_antarctica.AAC.1